MTEKKKKKRHTRLVVEEKVKIDVFSVLRESIEKYGAKKILTGMSMHCVLEYVCYTDSMAVLLADKKKIENSTAGKILFYALANWDEMARKADDFYQKKSDAAEAKQRGGR
jgi:hypothetical protein